MRLGFGAWPSSAINAASWPSDNVSRSDTLNTSQPAAGWVAVKAIAAARLPRETIDFCVSPWPTRHGLPAKICRTNAARLASLPGP